MTIARLNRVSLCGIQEAKEGTLKVLQSLGVMHLIPLRPAEPLRPLDPEGRHRAETAFRHLMESPERRRPHRPGYHFDLDGTIELILQNRRRLRSLGDRRDELLARIEDLEPWGDFALPALEDLGGLRLWLYPLPIKDRGALARLDLPWAIVGRGPTTLHLVVIAREEPPPEALPVGRIRAGQGPLSRLRAELVDTEIAIEEAEAERASLSRWRFLLGSVLTAAEDEDSRREAAEQSLDEGPIFAVQGWAPVDRIRDLEALAKARGLALLAEAPVPEDRPPTLLRAPRGLASASDLTAFYTSPGYRSWDPSLVVFVSFALFFAMILADAGYAALIGAATALFWGRLGRSESGRHLRVLLAVLAGTSFAYGVLAGSYFGLAPPPRSLAAWLDRIDVTDFGTMMRVSVGVGALHLTVAHAAAVWLSRGALGGALAPLGWIAAIWGGMALWIGGESAADWGGGLLAAGLVAVFAGAAAASNGPEGGWLRRLLAGLQGLSGVTRQFGDLLSYLRLFALGLASASLAATFNGLAADIRASTPGLGLLLGLLVLFFGHGVTFLLGIMSGVVHGLRLNYIEFFGWGLTEEGYPFRPFAKKEVSA